MIPSYELFDFQGKHAWVRQHTGHYFVDPKHEAEFKHFFEDLLGELVLG